MALNSSRNQLRVRQRPLRGDSPLLTESRLGCVPGAALLLISSLQYPFEEGILDPLSPIKETKAERGSDLPEDTQQEHSRTGT